jgi:hypothetical protein
VCFLSITVQAINLEISLVIMLGHTQSLNRISAVLRALVQLWYQRL